MPFERIEPFGSFVGGTPGLNVPDPSEELDPTGAQLAGAAFQTENVVGSFLANEARGFSGSPIDPDLDLTAELNGTKYEPLFEKFLSARNREHVEAIKRDIDREEENRRIIAASGTVGIAASMAAGFFDLPTLLPGGTAVRTARGGFSVLRTAGKTAIAGAVDASVSEAALRSTQQLRTAGESALNIGGSVVLAGLLGAGAGALLSKAERTRLSKQIEKDMEVPADDAPDPIMPGSIKAPLSASVDPVLDATNEVKSALGFEKIIKFQDPMMRLTVQSKSEVAKQVTQELVEIPFAFDKNARGFESAPSGSQMGTPGSIESNIRLWNVPLVKQDEFIDDAFVRYRKGRHKKFGDITRIATTDFVAGGNALTHLEFRNEVGRAMRRADTHIIPEVQEAARFARTTTYDPLKNQAISTNQLPEDVDVSDTAASFLNRVYNNPKIIAEKPKFKRRITAWLKSQQAIAQQERTSVERKAATRLQTLARQGPLPGAKGAPVAVTGGVSDTQVKAAIAGVKKTGKLQTKKISKDIIAETKKINKALDIETVKGLAIIDAEIKKELQTVETSKRTEQEKIKKVKILKVAEVKEKQQAALLAADEQLKRDLAAVADFKKQRIAAINKLKAEPAARVKLRSDVARETTKATGRVKAGRRKTKADVRNKANKAIDQAVKKEQLGQVKIQRDATRKAGSIRAKANVEKSRLKAKTRLKKQKELPKLRAKREKTKAKTREDTAKLLEEIKGIKVKIKEASQGRNIDLDEVELEDISDQIISRILSTPVGRLPYDLGQETEVRFGVRMNANIGARDSLARRVFKMPDYLLEEWLESDITLLTNAYVKTMAADTEIAKRFGSVDMVDQFKAIEADYARLSAAAPEGKAQKKLDKQKNRDMRDLATMRDRLRRTFMSYDNPDGYLARANEVALSFNFLRLLGKVALSSVPDVGKPVIAHGLLRTFRSGLIPLFSDFASFKASAHEARLSGAAYEWALNSRVMQLADIVDDYSRHSKFEQATHGLAHNFGVVNLLNTWNQAIKDITGSISTTQILMDVTAIAKGTATPKQAERILEAGISLDRAKVIAEQFAKHGTKSRDGGLWLPKTADWDKTAKRVHEPRVKSAMDALHIAVGRDVNRIIVTPGQERMIMMSKGVGKNLFQFKSFATSSVARTMIPALQKRDATVLNGILVMATLGGLVHLTRLQLAGRAMPDFDKEEDVTQFMVDAVDRSGLLGYAMDINGFAEKLSGGVIGTSAFTGQTLSRYRSRNLVGSLAGPTGGALEELGRTTRTVFTGDVNEGDVRAMRRLIPYQNLLYTQALFDKAEKEFNNFFGVKRRTRKK